MQFWRGLCWWLPPFALQTIIVNLKSGEALRGVLWRTRGGWYVLRQPALLKAGQPPVPMDGELVVERANVDFVQVLP